MTSEGGVAGEPAKPSFCSNCGREQAPGSNFCPGCGKPLASPQPLPPPVYYDPYGDYKALTLRDVVRGAGTYSAVALFILMAVNVVIALWAIGLVYPVMDTATASIYVITPFIVRLFSFSGLPFLIYYVLLVAAIVASFIWALGKSLRPLGSELWAKAPAAGHSPLYMVGTLFMAVLSFNLIFYFAVEGTGVSPSTPGFQTYDLWELIFSFAQASVWEEVVSRMLLIGVPLLILDYAVARAPEDGGRRSVLNYLLGGGFTIGKREAFFLAFSSAMFGVAHVFAWDPFKIVPSAVAGLAFGYLFLKVGIYASILLHFAFDFLSIPMEVFPESEVAFLAIGLALIAWLVVGVPYMLLYASKGAGWLVGRPLWPDKPLTKKRPAYAAGYYQPAYYPPAPYQSYQPAPLPPRPPPPTYGRPYDPTAIGFACRNCGHREALYKDGELTCTRCGAKN